MTKIKYLTIIVCLSNLMSLVAQTRMESSLKENDGSQLWLPTINVSKMKEKTPQISYQGKLSKTISIAIFELQNAWRGQPIILEKTRKKNRWFYYLIFRKTNTDCFNNRCRITLWNLSLITYTKHWNSRQKLFYN